MSAASLLAKLNSGKSPEDVYVDATSAEKAIYLTAHRKAHGDPQQLVAELQKLMEAGK